MKLVKVVVLVKLLKLVSVHIFDIWTPKKAQNTLFFLHFWLPNVLRATMACTFSTFQRQKVVRTPQSFTLLTWTCASRHNGVHFWTSDRKKVVRSWRVTRRVFSCILTWKCASRDNGVHFFDISTSKSGPRMVCFVHFDLEMCFAPQRRALFRPLNFQKWSENGVFCALWLGNVLRVTAACNFSSLIWPDGSAPAALASVLFDHPLEKHSESRLSYLFAHLHLLSSHSFSSLLFSLLGSSSLTLPTSAFPSVHTVGSFTSKLPSINMYIYTTCGRMNISLRGNWCSP